MRVLALPRYARSGASSRVRFHQFLPALRRSGLAIRCAPLVDDDYLRQLYAGRRPSPLGLAAAYAGRLRLLAMARRYDLLWIEKELLPWLPGWGEALLARCGRPYVVDFDDAWFHRYDHHPSRLVRALLGGKLDRVMRCAALVVAGNAYLAERARQAGSRRVAVVPSVVDAARYPAVAARPDDRPVTIVWIGSPSTAGYLALAVPALARACAGRAAELLLIGAGPVTLDGLSVRHVPWSEATEAELLAQGDIGIMPLPDGLWERGKCGYKLIQYMAAGLPVVASPVGVNADIVTPATGFLAADTEDWIAALQRLLDDPALRRDMGRAGRERMERHYALAVWGPRLEALLRTAAGG